jgi:hypothetical protein
MLANAHHDCRDVVARARGVGRVDERAARELRGCGEQELFRSGLESFLPIPQPVEANHCTDSYPEWTIALEFDGGGKLELANHRSDLIPIGGPFQMTMGGVTYLNSARS